MRKEDDRLVRALERIARALEKLIDIQEVRRSMWKSSEKKEVVGMDREER